VGVKMSKEIEIREKREEDIEMQEIEIDKIYIPETRCNSHFDDEEFKKFLESITSVGLLQPITVCKGSPDLKKPYTLLDGKNRLETYKKLGYKTIPVQIVEKLDPLLYSLHVNLHRGNADPIELAEIIDKMMEEGKSSKEIAEMLKISDSRVRNLRRLIRLPTSVKEAVRQRTLSIEQALEIQSMTEDTKKQEIIAKEVIKKGMSVQELREKKEGLISLSERKCAGCGVPSKDNEGRWFYLCAVCAEKLKS
jgi:ParB family chromosome partitioning protein